MSSMDDLVQFIRDRLTEDEQTARAAGNGWYGYDPEQQIAFVPPGDSRHIARHNPPRILREVEAKRRLLDEHQDVNDGSCGACVDGKWGYPTHGGSIPQSYPCRTLRLLTLPYADHPDYREDWRP